MSSSNSAPRPQPATSASQWQLAHGQAAVEWMHSSGVAQRMLTDIGTAVEKTVDWLIQDDTHRARWVIQQFP